MNTTTSINFSQITRLLSDKEEIRQHTVGSQAVTTADTRNPRSGRFAGVAWCLLHALFLAIFSTIVKFVRLPPDEKLLVRCCVQFFFLFPYMQLIRTRDRVEVFVGTGATKVLLLRAVVGPLSSLLAYQALERISLGDAVSISFTNVVFAGIFGRVFLGESYARFDMFFSAVALAGVVLIAKPDFIFGAGVNTYGLYELAGVGLAILSAAGLATSLILIRSMGRCRPILNVFYFTWGGCLLSGAWMAATGSYEPPCVGDFLLISCTGVLGLASQLALTKALQTERASFVAVMRSLQLVLVFILQVKRRFETHLGR